MTRCSKCNKEIGWLGAKYACSFVDCQKVYCSACSAALKECTDCEKEYCSAHITPEKHQCEAEEIDEEEDDTEEDTEEENEDPIQFYGKNKRWAVLDAGAFSTNEEQFTAIEKELQGYTLRGISEERNEWIFIKSGEERI